VLPSVKQKSRDLSSMIESVQGLPGVVVIPIKVHPKR